MTKICPDCGKYVYWDHKYCGSCTANREITGNRLNLCKKCKAVIDEDGSVEFCDDCYEEINDCFWLR